MATHVLKVLMSLLGAAAIAIALCFIVLGVSATGGFFESLYNSLAGSTAPLTGDYSATAESELRFYSVLWAAYGVLALMAAQRFEARGHWIPWLALVFFGGGVARLISYFADGAPHPFFVLLMVIELALPPILFGLWWLSRKAD